MAVFRPADSIAFGEKALVIGRNTIDLPYWKGYKGGTRAESFFTLIEIFLYICL
jgi:tricorn protease-like protein